MTNFAQWILWTPRLWWCIHQFD